jgi:hypothetical protein
LNTLGRSYGGMITLWDMRTPLKLAKTTSNLCISFDSFVSFSLEPLLPQYIRPKAAIVASNSTRIEQQQEGLKKKNKNNSSTTAVCSWLLYSSQLLAIRM